MSLQLVRVASGPANTECIRQSCQLCYYVCDNQNVRECAILQLIKAECMHSSIWVFNFLCKIILFSWSLVLV